jgi:hypothetical protein
VSFRLLAEKLAIRLDAISRSNNTLTEQEKERVDEINTIVFSWRGKWPERCVQDDELWRPVKRIWDVIYED